MRGMLHVAISRATCVAKNTTQDIYLIVTCIRRIYLKYMVTTFMGFSVSSAMRRCSDNGMVDQSKEVYCIRDLRPA